MFNKIQEMMEEICHKGNAYNRSNFEFTFTFQKYHVTVQGNEVKQIESLWNITDWKKRKKEEKRKKEKIIN